MRRFMGFLVCILLILPAGVRSEGFIFFEPIQPPRPFQVMAHRGMASVAPENTARALERAIADGLEWAEVDVRLTKDGHHVLIHDSTLDGKTNGKGAVKEHSLEEILALDAGSPFAARFTGEHLLTLADALKLAKDKINLYLDCKDVDPLLLIREIHEADMEKQVVVFDDLKKLKQVREASGGKVAVMPKWHPPMGTTTWIDDNKPAAVEIDANEVTPEIVKAFHARGVKVQIKVLGEWDKGDVWSRVIADGADWLQTDLPEEIIAQELWIKKTKHPVMISCHRGGNHYAPENTMPAFEKAVKLGADFIEFDVRATSDGKYFLLHDGNLNRTTTGTGPISSATSEEVAKLDAGSWYGKPYVGVKLPTLEEFLTWAEGQKVQLYFDAKAIKPEDLAEAVNRHHLGPRTAVYQGFTFLKKLKEIDPKIRAMPPLGRMADLEGFENDLKPATADTKWEMLSKSLIERCHAHGTKVFSDALGAHEKIADYQQAIRDGIDLIQTDVPLRVIRAVETLGE